MGTGGRFSENEDLKKKKFFGKMCKDWESKLIHKLLRIYYVQNTIPKEGVCKVEGLTKTNLNYPKMSL